MNLTILLIVAAIMNVGLGLFVWNHNKDSRTNQSFGIMAYAMGVWVLLNYLLQIVPSVLLLELILFVGLFIAIAVFTWVSMMRSGPDTKYFKPLLYILVVTGLVMGGLIFDRDLVVAAVRSATEVTLGRYFTVYALYLGFLLCLIIVQIITTYRQSNRMTRDKLRFSGIGLAIFCALVILFDVVLPIFGITNLGMLDSPSSLIFLFFTAYSIAVHRLFDIRVIIRRTIVYSVLLAFVLVTYAVVVLVFSQVLGGNVSFGVSSFAPNVIAAIFIAVGFDPLKQWLQRITDKYLFKGEYDPQDLATELAKMLSNVVNLDEALDSMMAVVTKQMRIGQVATLVIRTVDKDRMVKHIKTTGFSNVANLEGYPTGALIEYFIKNPRMLVIEEEQDQSVSNSHSGALAKALDQLERFHAAVALPLLIKGSLIGVLMVGPKLSGDSFSRQDLDALELTGSQTALSIEKAQFYEEDKLKSEFISIASHELLTPTAAIEGYLSMALDKKMPQTEVQRQQYMQRAYDSSRRLADLVKDLLSISRIESGRMKVVPAPMDLAAIVEQAVGELQVAAQAKNLNLQLEKPNTALPKVIGDPDRMMQVCINLINNAIKYTPKGSVDVTMKLVGDNVAVSVADTGIGIAPDDQKHLFEKFHRIDNPATAGIMGTGLGLYIVKNIMTLLGGSVTVDSTAGKGSTFTFTLPVAKSS